MPKFLAFEIPDAHWFLVFGVSNAKYLAFGTPDGDARTKELCTSLTKNFNTCKV